MNDGGKKHGGGAAVMSPCAACKLLRRRCVVDCIFAPHFPADEPRKFASVHKVFGASNVNKLLQTKGIVDLVQCPNGIKSSTAAAALRSKELPEQQRGDAVSSMVYEANARVRDPVYGCVGAISSLQQRIDALQTQLAMAQAEIVHLRMQESCATTTTVTTSTSGASNPNISGMNFVGYSDHSSSPIWSPALCGKFSDY